MTNHWEQEIDNPEPYVPIYLKASTIKNLKYTLDHHTHFSEYGDVTLSEAINSLCHDWIKYSNIKLAMDRGDLIWKEPPLDKNSISIIE